MAERMPILRQDDMLEMRRQPVNPRHNFLAARHGQLSAGAEVILDIDHQQEIARADRPTRDHARACERMNLFGEGGKLVRQGVASELLECLRLNLPDTLASHSEDLPYFFQSMIPRIANSEAHAQDSLLSRRQLR